MIIGHKKTIILFF